MADRWAVANGNWSNTATWNGGTLPGAGDDVYADNRVVTIDQDITVLSIRTTQRSGGTAGGNFTAGSGTRVFNCDVIAGTTDCLVLSAASSTYTLNGNVTGGGSTGAEGVLLSATSTTTLTINGNVTGGSANTANGFTQTSSAISVVNGTITGGTNAVARGVNIASGVCTVTGNIVGATSQAIVQTGGSLNVSTTSISVTGTVSAIQQQGGVSNITCSTTITGSTSGAGGLLSVSGVSANCTINANIASGSSGSQIGVTLGQGGFVRVNGNLIGSSGVINAPAVSMTNCSLSVFGNVIGNTSRGIHQNSGSVFVVGDVTAGSGASGDGVWVSSSATDTATCIVYGTVTGGSAANAFGVENAGGATVYIFGEVVDATATATSNSGSGSITVVPVGGGSSIPLIGPGLVY